jgi:hypothetical protein
VRRLDELVARIEAAEKRLRELAADSAGSAEKNNER